MSASNGHEWIRGNETYRERLIAFNYRPASWARVERLRALCPMDVDVALLRSTPRSERQLSRWLITLWGPAASYAFDFPLLSSRIALVSVDALETLAERLGLLAYTDIFRLRIRRDERARLVETLGESRRQYALAGTVRYGAELPLLASAAGVSSSDDVTLDRVRETGWRIALSCVGDVAPAVRQRLALKLPLGIEADSPEGGHINKTTNGVPECWPAVERVLKSEFSEEWRSCFC